jgi:hypothetical protein
MTVLPYPFRQPAKTTVPAAAIRQGVAGFAAMSTPL